MVDSVLAAAPQKQFTEVKYVTKDGENVTATKKDGVVTLVGDKNGVRQMPVEEFFTKELVNNAKPLERAPEKDTVELSKTEKPEAKKETDKAPTPEAKDNAQPQVKAEVGKKLDVAV